MGREFVLENAESRSRLRRFIHALNDQELSLPAGDGWTVSSLLAHLAFWDYRALTLIQRWSVAGVGSSPIDVDSVNDATKPLCLALPPRRAAELALEAAEAIDSVLEDAPDQLIETIEALGGKFRLRRAEHRQEHLDQIRRTINTLDHPFE